MFLKIGDVTLNSDKIVSVEDTDEGLHVFTDSTSGDQGAAQPYYLIPSGQKADALRRWLDDCAIDLLAVDEDANEQELVETMNKGAGGVTYDIRLEYGGVQGGHYTAAPYVCEDCGDDGIVYHPAKK